MKAHSLLFLLLVVFGLALHMEAQPESSIKRKAKGTTTNPDELVSFNSDVPYAKAIQSLGELSRLLEGKLLIDRSPMQGKEKTIGINIEAMYWKDALELILRSNQLWYNDYPEYMEILSFEQIGKIEQQQSKGVPSADVTKTPSPIPTGMMEVGPVEVDSSEYYSQIHEVTISGIFFDLNRTAMSESGMDFNIFRGSGLNLGINITGASRMQNRFLTATASPRGDNISVDIDATLGIFESEQLGEVLARPQLSVRSGSSSIFQIGQDFSVLEKDFSGNTIQKFYPTGTILTVRPKIYKIGDVDFIDILYKVEKSTFETSALTTVINKTVASGSLILLNGEEGYVGGMYSTEETTIRHGVPVLKDLPWWVFGLRYIFGYDSKRLIKRELIVLLKAEILPSVEERAVKQPAARNMIKDAQKEMQQDIERRKNK